MRVDYKWRAAIVVAIGLFMAILDNTIVNVALPQMQAAFNTDRQTITWVVTAYFLAQAAVIPIIGYVSDLIGTKLVFVSALALFTLGSALCAFTPQIQPYLSFAQGDHLLIAFRILQGVGGGALFPLAFAIIFRVFPPTERAPASAVVGVPVLLAPAFGPTIGGYLTTTFDWSAIFTVNIPVGAVALLLALLVLRGRKAEMAASAGEPQPARGRFDILGLVLAMASSTALVYGITEAAGPNGWTDSTADAYLIVGGVLLVAFVITELIVKDPVMDMRLFLNYTFASANVLTWAVSGLLFGGLFLLPIFFEQVQGKSAFDTGVALISQGLAAAVATILTSRLYNRVGPRWLIALGFALITAGTYGFSQLAVDSSVLSLQGWLVLRGLGLGFTNIPLQTLALSGISNRAMARASSLANVTRQVFGAVGISTLTTYFLQQMSGYFSHAAPPALQARGVSAAICLDNHAVTTTPGLAQICGPVVTSAINDAFFATMIGCAIGIALALLVGRDPSLVAARRARQRGEVVPQPVLVGE
jgi:EmrB/QacA subfamily drug resistance transporter